MPTMSENEIKANIADGTIFAVSVDTAVFDKYGCNLDFTVLNKLDQFKTYPIKVMLSEIVVNEIKTHIVRDAEECQRELHKAIKKQGNRWKTGVDIAKLPDALALSGDPIKAAERQLKDYLAAVGGEVVRASDTVDVSGELLRRYFATEPPFESGGQKKHEFPDCFALLSLESVAKSHQKLLLCISTDNGWKNFAAQSPHVVCVPDLELALSYFNDSGRNVADQTMAMWKSETAPELDVEIEHAFEYRLSGTDFEADGWSPFNYEIQPISAVMQWVNRDTASAPRVIAADENAVTFTTNVKAIVGFEANFGSERIYVEDESEFELVITVLRDIDPEPHVVDVEVAKKRLAADFGYISINEDPTHEKY
jgi:hypothetical protein